MTAQSHFWRTHKTASGTSHFTATPVARSLTSNYSPEMPAPKPEAKWVYEGSVKNIGLAKFFVEALFRCDRQLLPRPNWRAQECSGCRGALTGRWLRGGAARELADKEAREATGDAGVAVARAPQLLADVTTPTAGSAAEVTLGRAVATSSPGAQDLSGDRSAPVCQPVCPVRCRESLARIRAPSDAQNSIVVFAALPIRARDTPVGIARSTRVATIP